MTATQATTTTPTTRRPRLGSSPARTRKRRRLYLLLAGLVLLGGSAGLVLSAFEESLVFFYSPSELQAKAALPAGRAVRLGGLVEAESLAKEADGLTVAFRVTDGAASLPVRYKGVLPDLFREGQGVVVEGVLSPGGVFEASEVLAKHDENYMPREVADALKASGHWKDGEAAP